MHFGAVQEACSSDMLGGPGAEKGCVLEHQIFRFAKMILCDRCSTSYDLASLSRGRRNTFDRWTGKIGKRIDTSRQRCTELSIFEGSLAEVLCF